LREQLGLDLFPRSHAQDAAILWVTLVATCEARGINPFAYLADVIPRVQDHAKRRLDELLASRSVGARAGQRRR